MVSVQDEDSGIAVVGHTIGKAIVPHSRNIMVVGAVDVHVLSEDN